MYWCCSILTEDGDVALAILKDVHFVCIGGLGHHRDVVASVLKEIGFIYLPRLQNNTGVDVTVLGQSGPVSGALSALADQANVVVPCLVHTGIIPFTVLNDLTPLKIAILVHGSAISVTPLDGLSLVRVPILKCAGRISVAGLVRCVLVSDSILESAGAVPEAILKGFASVVMPELINGRAVVATLRADGDAIFVSILTGLHIVSTGAMISMHRRPLPHFVFIFIIIVIGGSSFKGAAGSGTEESQCGSECHRECLSLFHFGCSFQNLVCLGFIHWVVSLVDSASINFSDFM